MGRFLSEVDRAYLAGLVDGDGSVMATIERHPEKLFKFRVRITLKVTQRHKEHVAWLITFTGVGSVRPNRDAYEWITRDQIAVQELLEMILPYARIKKEQIKIALQILSKKVVVLKDLHDVAYLSDKLAACNVRSMNRRKNFAALILESNPRND